ncbi:glycoside hydrolase family 79 protein [Neolentinus lepideus HHB14362 ss-1]|uniref:Glycoside hydrolase family 79 protein n=1 Tax=Neolentinus lepideus HHB14362 ss-1 TaxID=1314782 RepID=A0A165TVN8_9AGAM|nr:glycoside hydrolase family 79 protein [Neolentinus lepideus HHB14362 ss-1]
MHVHYISFLSASVLLCASIPSAASPDAAINVIFPSSPPASSAVNVVYDNFLGISFELSSFNTLWGENTSTVPPAILNYLHNIRSRLGDSSPLRIRVGGNSMDESVYTPKQTQMLTFPDPNAPSNNIPTNFGPLLWDVMTAVSTMVGGITYLVGLSMREDMASWGEGNVVDTAVAARKALGTALDGFLLGNEPDFYSGHGNNPGYNISLYINDVGTILDGLRNSPSGNLIQSPLIGGPTVCCGWDLKNVITSGLDGYNYKYYSMQHYPTHICGGENPTNTNMSYFLSHSNLDAFVSWNQEGIKLAKASGIPMLLTEYNSVACGGSNISDTFAITLWAVDVALKHAASNFSSVYLHTREYGVRYNLFDPPSAPPDPSNLNVSSTPISLKPGWRTGSPYYAELVLAETLSRSGSVVVDLNLNNSETNPAASVAAYGIYDSGGSTRGKLVLFNFADTDSKLNQTFRVPGGLKSIVETRLLLASAVDARTGITWAGQTVGEVGDLQGDQVTVNTDCWNGCAIQIPGPGLAVVWVGDDTMWTGNSTLPDFAVNGDCRAGDAHYAPVVLAVVIAGLLAILC